MMNPTTKTFRFTVLFFNCLLTFGSYFCFDMPSTLKDRFQQQNVSQYVYNTSGTPSIPANHTTFWQYASNATTVKDCETACSSRSPCLEYEWDAMVKNDQCSNDYRCQILLINETDARSDDYYTGLVDVETNEEASMASWFGPIPAASGKCANDTHGVRESNIEYCPAKNEAELDLSSFQYESFYASYAWTNAAMVIVAGIIVDKLGNHLALGLFSFNCLLGSSLFAAGASLQKYELMLVGRIIFGLGNGSLTIVQNKITATWFEGKELALAF
eukprot:gene14278-18706_t